MATTTGNFYTTQIKNRNYLSPVGFNLTLNTKEKVEFFSNTATIPALTLGTAIQTTPLRNIDVPGDVLLFDDFTMSFLVDEDLKNYMIVHNWLKGLGFPESYQWIGQGELFYIKSPILFTGLLLIIMQMRQLIHLMIQPFLSLGYESVHPLNG